MFRVLRDLLRYDGRFRFAFILLAAVVVMILLSFVSPYDPNKTFVVPTDWLVCPNMKRCHLRDVLASLENDRYVVQVEPQIADPARKALSRMLEVTKK